MSTMGEDRLYGGGPGETSSQARAECEEYLEGIMSLNYFVYWLLCVVLFRFA